MAELRLSELTPRGAGAVSVVVLEGPGALEQASSLCGRSLVVGELSLVRLRCAGEDLDEALALARTTEAVELHLHGSPPLVRKLRAALGLEPHAAASRSEQERALELLPTAPSQAGARILLDQAEGALARRVAAWAELSDEALLAERTALVEESRVARFALEPIRVVLAGPVNAGKSTLFNALVGHERVITSAEEGTTRDLVSQRADLEGWPAELVDTAGERALPAGSPQAEVELEGQRLARAARAGADVVLWLRPPGGEGAEPGLRGEVCVELATKVDLAGEGGAAGASGEGLSALADPSGAARRVASAVRSALQLPATAWRAGRGVAFDAQSRAWLGQLVELEPGALRRAAETQPGSSAER
jgi:tRNA modification GTPase